MKIRSRATSDPIAQGGSGQYLLALDRNALRLIAALMYVTRLGSTQYKSAAFEVFQAIEHATNIDFVEESFNFVLPEITETTDRGAPLRRIGSSNFIIEV